MAIGEKVTGAKSKFHAMNRTVTAGEKVTEDKSKPKCWREELYQLLRS